MIVCLAVLYTFHNGSCICKATGYAYIDIHSLIRYGKFLDSLFTTNTALCNLMHGFLAVIRAQSSKNCLGNTTGNTEDNATAGTKSKRHIACFRIQCCKIKTKVIDHAEKLCGCDNDIGILLAIGKAVGADCLCLLGCTWHNGNHNGLLACCMLRITEVFLDNRRHHSLWGTAGRNVRNIFFILISDKLHPCRTAGSQKRKILTLLHSV